MESPIKKCSRCQQPKPLKEFWGQKLDDGLVYLSMDCNTCTGRAAYNDLKRAQQLFYYYVECMVWFNVASRGTASSLHEFCDDDLEIIIREKMLKGLYIDRTMAEAIWYTRKADLLRRSIASRVRGNKPIKREAFRVPGRGRGDAKAWLLSDEPFEFSPRKIRGSSGKIRKSGNK